MSRSSLIVVVMSVAFMVIGFISAAEAAPPERYACTHAGERSFSRVKSTACVPLPREPGWETLFASPKIIVDYHPGSTVRDGDSVKAWVQFNMADTYILENGRGKKYDTLRASYRFDCKSRQQTLIQGSYKLGSQTVYERLSNEAVIEEIEPDTISEHLFNILCKGEKTPASQQKSSTSRFEDTFICPEQLPDDHARTEQIKAFLDWMTAVHPTMNTIRDVAEMRVRLMESHQCTQTLAAIRQNKY